MNKTLWIVLSAALVLTGCNTVEGVGRDISASANTVRGWFGGR